MKTLFIDCSAGISSDMLLAALKKIADFTKTEVTLPLIEDFSRDTHANELHVHSHIYKYPEEKGAVLIKPHSSHGHIHEHPEDLHCNSHENTHCNSSEHNLDHDHNPEHKHSHKHCNNHEHTHSHEHWQDTAHNHEHWQDTSHNYEDSRNKQFGRSLWQVRKFIENANVSDNAKQFANNIFKVLAKAEATVHGETLDTVHFHEVGRNQAIENVLGIGAILDALGLKAKDSSIASKKKQDTDDHSTLRKIFYTNNSVALTEKQHKCDSDTLRGNYHTDNSGVLNKGHYTSHFICMNKTVNSVCMNETGDSVYINETGDSVCINETGNSVYMNETSDSVRMNDTQYANKNWQILISPIYDGVGFINCAHGRIPVPVPAVNAMKAQCPEYIFMTAEEVKTEMVTPSGLATLIGIGAKPICDPMISAKPAYDLLVGAKPACDLLVGAKPACDPMFRAKPICDPMFRAKQACDSSIGAKPACDSLSELMGTELEHKLICQPTGSGLELEHKLICQATVFGTRDTGRGGLTVKLFES